MIDLAVIPIWYQYLVVGAFGLIIGSFLNVVIYRLHTGRSLSGHSHCMSCGKSLCWYELLPLLSYLWQRGRCRGCASYIPIRYALCELLTAGVFVWLFAVLNDPLVFLLMAGVASVLIVVFFYDMYHLIIPNLLVVLLFIMALGHMVYLEPTGMTVLWQIVAGSATFLFFGGLWWYSEGRWVGLGDAKLATPLALMLNPELVFSFVVLSFWIGSVVGVSLLLLAIGAKKGKRYLPISLKRFTIKSEVPFAPFLILSFLLVYVYRINILDLFIFILNP